MKMIDMLDAQAKQYLAGINLRNIQVEALNKLLNTNYTADAKEALSQSGFTDGMLSARQLHSLIVNQAASWIVEILQGNWASCPIPKAAGLNQSLSIAWFKANGESVAERIAIKKVVRAKAKADAKADAEEKAAQAEYQAELDAQSKQLQLVEEQVQAKLALVEAYAVEDAVQKALVHQAALHAQEVKKMRDKIDAYQNVAGIMHLINMLEDADCQSLLAALATKYPKAQATKRGKGTDQPTLPV